MKLKGSKFYTAVSGLTLIILMIASMGLKCNVEGNRPGNLPPSVKFANIPSEGTSFTSQPLLYWFGKDLDGFIAEYQYVVFKASQIQLLGYDADSTGVEDSFIVFLKTIPAETWTDSLTQIGKKLQTLGEEVVRPVELVTRGGAGQTSDRIQLFASSDPSKIILQFIFLRAVDNAGALSEVIYRRFFRTNNPPNSRIEFNTKEIYYSLDDTTRTWKGIQIGWGGTDSIDYPIGEPPLEFFWKLFYLGNTPDTLNKVVIDSSFDSNDGDKWVTTKSAVLPTGLQTGYHMFRVTARDDALIPDPTPADSIFYVIKPAFNKNVLLVDLTFFFSGNTGSVTDPDFYRPYYEQLFSSAGYPLDTIWGDPNDQPTDASPREPLLSQYKLVVVLNHDHRGGVFDSLGRQLNKYLDVGGKVWLTGINNFTTGGTFLPDADRVTNGYKFSDQKRIALTKSELGYPCDLGMQYCGLEAYFMPGWGALYDSIDCVNGSNCQPNYHTWPSFPAGRNEELIGVSSLLPAPWPATMELDTVNVKAASTLDPDRKILLRNKLPRANYAIISSIHAVYPDLPPAQALYLVNSSYGSTPASMHGKPAIVRYQGPTFQTAVCTFPLYYLKMDQASQFTEQLLAWFGLP